jgi:hypothetical protein
MRTIVAALSLALLEAVAGRSAVAQTARPDTAIDVRPAVTPNGPSAARREAPEPAAGGRPRRAPLALPDDLAPAVDVSPTAAASASDTASSGAPESSAARTATVPASGGARTTAAHTIDLGTTSITGNQELPKVLYIVPWKRSDLGELVGRPVNTLLDEVLAPVDPEVFERHLQYYESLFGAREEE